MPLNTKQLESRVHSGLDGVYLVAGEEPLLIQEAADAIRAKARERGFDEREVLAVEPGFNWERLHETGANLSLFSSRRLIELRLADARPGEAGSRALQAYVESPPPDAVMLVLAGSLDRKARSSKWFKALESAGAAVYVWPVKPHQLPRWIEGRMRAAGLAPERGAAETLAALTEGNLLAAAQGIQRLALLHAGAPISTEQIRECVADNARFNVFDLADKLLAGRIQPVLRSLDRLREEGVEPALVLWALARELRSVAAVADRVARGATPDKALAEERVWASRKRLVGQAAQRLGSARALALLQGAARADRVNKGAEPGQPWEELVNLCIRAC